MESKAVFEATQIGDFKLLKDLYSGSINQVNKEQLNLLSVVLTNSDKIDDRIKIVNFLIDRGIDINYQEEYVIITTLITYLRQPIAGLTSKSMILP